MIVDNFKWTTPILSDNFLQRVVFPDFGNPITEIFGLMLKSRGIVSTDWVYFEGSFKNFYYYS